MSSPFDGEGADADRREVWAETLRLVLQKAVEPGNVRPAVLDALWAADEAVRRYTAEFGGPMAPEEGDFDE